MMEQHKDNSGSTREDFFFRGQLGEYKGGDQLTLEADFQGGLAIWLVLRNKGITTLWKSPDLQLGPTALPLPSPSPPMGSGNGLAV